MKTLLDKIKRIKTKIDSALTFGSWKIRVILRLPHTKQPDIYYAHEKAHAKDGLQS